MSNGLMSGFNGLMSSENVQNSQANTDNYPAYVFTYVAPATGRGAGIFVGGVLSSMIIGKGIIE